MLGPGTAAVEIIAAARRGEVSRTAGWISPVVVAGGRVAGVWDLDQDAVNVRLFEDAGPIPPARLATAIERTRSVLAALQPG